MSKHYTSRERRQRNLKYMAVVFAAIFLVSSVLLLVRIWENRQSQLTEFGSETASSNLEYKGNEYELKEDIETVLVLGLDKFETTDAESYNNDKQADFLMLLVIDHANSRCTALHINRDTIVEMAILGVAGDKVGTVEKQIALAHTYGNGREVSCRNVANAVSEMLMNVNVDHYVSVTMDAVSVYNDYIGGVEVTVLDDFTGIDDTLVKGEAVNLLGAHALNYVRSRYGLDDSTNQRRMVRQRQYLESLYEKSVECMNGNENFAVDVGVKLADYIVSDYSGNGLQYLAEQIADYQFVEICELEGKTILNDNHIEFYPDKSSIEETVIKLFYELIN